MNNLNHSKLIIYSRGITVVEILMVIALLAIVLSFALPSVGVATARGELQAAAENVEYSISTARNLARLNESAVAMTIRSASDGARSIGVGPADSPSTGAQAAVPDYLLPRDIELVSKSERFVFDSRGMVETPGTIVLQHRDDESLSRTLSVD